MSTQCVARTGILWMMLLMGLFVGTIPGLASTDESESIHAIDISIHGGPLNDRAFDVLVLPDGGTLIVGMAGNTGPSHRVEPGMAHVIRTNSEGSIVWERDYGGDLDAFFTSVVQTDDGAYVLLGEIETPNVWQEADMYLVKIDADGEMIWEHTFGGRGMDHAKQVRQTSDGGYILIGSHVDQRPTAGVYQADILLIRTDPDGNQVWSQTYGDGVLYLGWAVVEAPDGGFVLTGWEAKDDIADRDVLAMKVDALGHVEWSRSWNPGERDGGFDMILTSDGHIVIACIESMGSGAPSASLLKLDLEGRGVWGKTIGEQGVGNTFWHIMEDADGSYVMVGDTHVGRVPETGEDVHAGLMIKTDPEGEILWQRTFGKGDYDQVSFNSAAVLPGGGYIVAGRVTLLDGKYSDTLWLTTGEPRRYFGLEPPTERPEPFVPEVVSLNGNRLRESDIGFWPDGLRCFFARFGDGIPDYTIFECQWTDDGWTEPAPSALFPNGAFEPSLSPDGRRIFYVPPDPPARHGGHVLHMMELASGEWSAPEPLFRGLYASADLDGTLYYTTFYRNKDHVAYRVLEDGSYGEQQLFGSNVYDPRHEDAHPCIAPDGGYLIFDSDTRPRDGVCYLYVSFRIEDGMWTEPVNMKPILGNLPAALARISPDGKALFFQADGDIYWIAASAIEALR